jgi:hypothetical protein
MLIKSVADRTLFWRYFIFYVIFAIAFSIPFWRANVVEEILDGSAKHIAIGLVYILLLIVLALWALSWMLTKFVVTQGQIKVIDWFGLRQKTYTLPNRLSLKVMAESTPHRFRLLSFNGKYVNYKTLHIKTQEGKKLRIQSRYYENFEELIIAIKKASD